MSQEDFKDRLSRISVSAQEPVHRVDAEPPRQRKSRWRVWAFLALTTVAAFVYFSSGDPKPTFAEVFPGESAPAFAGELNTREFMNYGFALDLPSDWRERTRAEKDSVGGSFAEFIEGIDVESFTHEAATSDEFMFAIMTARTTDTDPTQSVAALQDLADNGIRAISFLADVSVAELVPPTTVDGMGLPSAEAVSHTKRPAGNYNSLYRSYILGADLVMILIMWEDMDVHPSAFAPVLDSLREI